MFSLYSFFVSIILCVLSYPYLKLYQMEGYRIIDFAKNIFTASYKEDKNKLVFTKRMIRICIALFLTLFAIFVPVFLFFKSFWIILISCLLMALLLPLILFICHWFIFPLEELIKFYYLEKAKKKLKKFKGLKIAIVGSYGKTSLKNILYEILKRKYKVITTPKNYNTPMGITKMVLSSLKDDVEIAIFEMGAKRQGDIKQLVKLVEPDIGVLTAIGPQHIETFKNIEGVTRTKTELIENIKDDGKLYFNGANEITTKIFKKCKKEKVLTCSQEGVSNYKNLKISKKGLAFDLTIRGETKRVETKLLGQFNCENIVIASTIAKDLGLSLKEIALQIKCLTPIKNRLELIDTKSFTIIDDSYNANPVGCEESLNVLGLFDGEKIVVTSGMVELGSLQYEKNFVLGKQIASVANKVIIMNETNKKAIYEGLLSKGFNLNSVYFAATRQRQKEILLQLVKKGCVVLFQNDLPDNFK